MSYHLHQLGICIHRSQTQSYQDGNYCVVECSDPKSTCLADSTCMTAPKELTNDRVKKICLFQKTAYEQPAFDTKDKECQTYEHYSTTTFIGLTYGSCLPPLESGKCPDKPSGFTQSSQKSAEKTKEGNETCELPCNAQTDCSDSTVCIPKPSQKLFGTQFQGVVFTGVCKYPSGHHSFNSPYELNSYVAGCKEKAKDGVDIVEFAVEGGTKASICTPNAFSDGFCPTGDLPDGYFKTPTAFKDTTGTHCQLPCETDANCVFVIMIEYNTKYLVLSFVL